jgi:flagellin
MPLSINTNIASMSAQRSFLNSNSALETAYERLASGKRINSASDDAAGLAVSTDLSSRARGLNQAVRNVNDGISMVQIMDSTLDEVTSIVQRMRDLAVQAANGSLTTTETTYLQSEITTLSSAIDTAIDQAKFGGVDLASDGAAKSVVIQAGATSSDAVTLSISIAGVSQASSLGVSAIDLTGSASAAIGLADTALDTIAGHRATLGAHQAQLESTVRNLSNVEQNTAAAAGSIMDTDYASETANLTT